MDMFSQQVEFNDHGLLNAEFNVLPSYNLVCLGMRKFRKNLCVQVLRFGAGCLKSCTCMAQGWLTCFVPFLGVPLWLLGLGSRVGLLVLL